MRKTMNKKVFETKRIFVTFRGTIFDFVESKKIDSKQVVG